MADTQPTSPDVAFVRRVLIVVAIGAVVVAVWALSDVLLLLFGSVLVAVMLRAIADPPARYLGVADRWALALAGVVVIGVLAAGVWFLGPELARQMRSVFDRLPAAFGKIAEALQLGSFADLLKGSDTASSLGSLASRIFSWSTTVLGALASLGLVVLAASTWRPTPDSIAKAWSSSCRRHFIPMWTPR